MFRQFSDAFPLVEPVEIEALFPTDERVICRFRIRLRHAKYYFGIPPTNREILFTKTHVQRLREGTIVENVVSATNLKFEMLLALLILK